MRTPLIAGNWKMYKTPKESLAFLEAFIPMVAGHTRDEIAVFPTMSSLNYAIDATAGTNVHAGAQNMHWLNEGPYTGETSPTMLLSIGCRHVLQRERRTREPQVESGHQPRPHAYCVHWRDIDGTRRHEDGGSPVPTTPC